MRTIRTTFLITLTALALACGYGNKNYMTNSPPVIAQLNPAGAMAGGPAFTITVKGSNFATQAVVNWNGAAQTAGTRYMSSGQLSLSVPASMIMNAGTVQVTVTNPRTPASGMYGGTPAMTSMPMNFTIN